MFTPNQSGFTIIEVTIVLAITSMLFISIYAGFAGSQNSSRATDAMEQVLAVIERTKVEASTVSVSGSDSGCRQTAATEYCTAVGRSILLLENGYASADVITEVQDIAKSNQDDDVLSSSRLKNVGDEYEYKWGAVNQHPVIITVYRNGGNNDKSLLEVRSLDSSDIATIKSITTSNNVNPFQNSSFVKNNYSGAIVFDIDGNQFDGELTFDEETVRFNQKLVGSP